MLTNLLISLLGAGIFLHMVGREKNRRYRHLLLRVEAARQRQAEARKPRDEATQAATAETAPEGAPVQTFEPIGQAA